MATPKTSVTATDLANQQAFHDNEHPIAEDLSNIPEQAYDYVAQLIWNALSDRDGVLSGLTCTFAGGDAIVTVGDGSLIMQGNQAQHASANYTHTGADGTWYLYARPQTEADSTSTGDRSFVVSNRPVSFRQIEPATGETPDGSKKDFLLQHNRVIQSSFRGFVDGVSVGCTVSNSTGTGGYAEAHFTDAPGAGTTVTFYYDVETGGYGTIQSVDTQNKVSLEFDSNASGPSRVGYVCLCRYTVVGGAPLGGNVTAVTETGFKEFILDYDTAVGSGGPGGFKKALDLLYYLETGYTMQERNPMRYGTGFDVEPSGGTVTFTGDLVNGSTDVGVTNQTQYDAIKAGNTIYISDGAGSYEVIGGSGFDAYRVLFKTDSIGTGGTLSIDTGYLGATHAQANNIAFVRLGSLGNPLYESFIQNVETSLIKNGDGVEVRIDDDSDSGVQEFKVTHDDGTDPGDVLLRVSEDGTVDVPTKLTVPTPASATEAERHDHDHLGSTGGGTDILHPLATVTRGFFANASPATATAFPYEIVSTNWQTGFIDTFNFLETGSGAGVPNAISHILFDQFEYVRFRARKGVKKFRVRIHASYVKNAQNIDIRCKLGTVNDPADWNGGTEATWVDTKDISWTANVDAGWYIFDGSNGYTGGSDLEYDPIGGTSLPLDTDMVIIVGAKLYAADTSNILRYAAIEVYESE